MALLTVACVGDGDAVYDLRMPDRATFDAEAGPLLAKRCGDRGCHADALRPLSLFAPGRQRLAPDETQFTDPLTSAEWDANYDAVTGFLDTAHPRRSRLLQSALGRFGHDVIFEAASDPQFQAVEQWAGTSATPGEVP